MDPLYISTGRAADGKDKYFERTKIEKRIWLKIKRKENLLLAAPRRTGKSSILKNLERTPREGYLIKYKSVQSVDSTNEFFKQLYKLLLEEDSIFNFYKRHYEKAKGAVKSFVSKIRGFSTDGIEIDPEEHVDYYHECEQLLKTIPEDFATLLLLIDEYPDAVRNIANIDKNEAIRFLQLNRDLRQGLNHANIQFIYTGSIGLGNVVSKLDRNDLINDIVNIPVPPLKESEAKELISRLVMGLKEDEEDFEIDNDIKNYMLKKDSWLIPYYIQIIVDELFDFFESENPFTTDTIDKVIDKIIKDRYKYQDYFENWKTRLKQSFEKHEYRCALEILNYISKNGSIDYDSAYDLSVKHKTADLKEITNVLEYDGYINKSIDKEFRFNSIILKEWWYINVAD